MEIFGHLSNYFVEIKNLRSKKFDFFKIFVLDIGFITSFLIIALLINYIGYTFVAQTNTILLSLLILIYFLLVLFSYSLFKFLIMKQIKSSFNKPKIFYNFYLLNLFNIILLFIFWIIINLIVKSVNDSYKLITIIILEGIFYIFAFIYTNITQSEFLKSNNISNSIKKGFVGSFILKENKEIGAGIILFILFSIILTLIGFILGYANIDPYSLDGWQRLIGPLFGIIISGIFYILFTLTRYLLIRKWLE